MNLIEIMKASKPGDKLRYSKKPGIIYTKGRTTIFLEGMEINPWSFLAADWEIIPHEPKVMTAEEWYKQWSIKERLSDTKTHATNIFNEGVFNGKLELFLAIKDFYQSNEESIAYSMSAKILFKNLIDKLDPRK